MDIRISSTYVETGQHHKVRKVRNSGTRLCSYVPETKNMVISEQYTLKTSHRREGILKMVSRVLSSRNHRRGNTYINNPSRSDPRRPTRRLRRSFARLQAQVARLQAQVDQRAHAKRTWGLHQSTGATCGMLYLGGNPARS